MVRNSTLPFYASEVRLRAADGDTMGGDAPVRFLFRLLAVPTAAIAILIVLMNLAGRPLSAATPVGLSIATAAVVLALVAWGRHLAAAGRPGRAVLLAVGSWALFVIVMLANGLARQQVWN